MLVAGLLWDAHLLRSVAIVRERGCCGSLARSLSVIELLAIGAWSSLTASHLDNRDQVCSSLTKFGTVNIEMVQLIPLCALVNQSTSSSYCVNAPKICCRVEGGVGWGR